MNLERETEFIYFSVIVLASYNFFLCSFYGGQVRAGALFFSACLCLALFSLYCIMYVSIISKTFQRDTLKPWNLISRNLASYRYTLLCFFLRSPYLGP